MRRYLILCLGFNARQTYALSEAVKKRGLQGRFRIISQNYKFKTVPSISSYQKADFDYLHQRAYNSLFEKKGTSLFCKMDHRICVKKFAKSKNSCEQIEGTQCRDLKPEAIILFYFARKNGKIGNRFGHYSLNIALNDRLFTKTEALAEHCIKTINEFDSSDAFSLFSKKRIRAHTVLPRANFHSKMRDSMLLEIRDVSSFRNYMNTIVPKIGGSTIITDSRDLSFKIDKPHRHPTIRSNPENWLSAHYRHGLSFDPLTHFDVSWKSGKNLGNFEFRCISSSVAARHNKPHLNIFPNDEIQ